MSLNLWTNCMGISDDVIDNNGNSLGYVGFHDYDGYIPIADLRRTTEHLATKLNTSIYLLKTRAGYHLVSFQIQNPKQRIAWIRETLLALPSDYEPPESIGRILRLSKKWNTPKPTLLFAIIIHNNQFWSLGHVRTYIRNKNIPKEAFQFTKMFIPTNYKLCFYWVKRK